MAKDTEIEIQARIEKVGPLLAFLKKNGKLVGQVHQVDDYFTPAHRDFLAIRPATEWLRLRDHDGRGLLTYKYWHHNKKGQSNFADEFETGIENLATFKKVFAALNFKPLVTVDKTREIWRYRDYEIAIDHVLGLEEFVEIEYKGKKAVDPDKTAAAMAQFLKDLGCGKVELNYQGYPFLLLFPKEAKYQKV